jgi:hypothetical protein
MQSKLRLRVLLVASAAALALALTGGTARATSPDGYLHSLAMPPFCPFPWGTPDPSLAICQANAFAPRLALTSQSVILRGGDYEGSLADCTGYATAVTTAFTLDRELIPVTTQPCRYVPRAVENANFFVIPNWDYEVRSLIPAGSLSVGIHTLTWTATFNANFSYSLGCTDPSGRCTVPAGTVFNSTSDLVING